MNEVEYPNNSLEELILESMRTGGGNTSQ